MACVEVRLDGTRRQPCGFRGPLGAQRSGAHWGNVGPGAENSRWWMVSLKNMHHLWHIHTKNVIISCWWLWFPHCCRIPGTFISTHFLALPQLCQSLGATSQSWLGTGGLGVPISVTDHLQIEKNCRKWMKNGWKMNENGWKWMKMLRPSTSCSCFDLLSLTRNTFLSPPPDLAGHWHFYEGQSNLP